MATALGIAVAVANCAHEAWRWTRVKRKTDKDDALKLAKLAVLGQLLALARKLLVTLWAMLRDGTRWREPKGAPGLTPALAVT